MWDVNTLKTMGFRIWVMRDRDGRRLLLSPWGIAQIIKQENGAEKSAPLFLCKLVLPCEFGVRFFGRSLCRGCVLQCSQRCSTSRRRNLFEDTSGNLGHIRWESSAWSYWLEGWLRANTYYQAVLFGISSAYKRNHPSKWYPENLNCLWPSFGW